MVQDCLTDGYVRGSRYQAARGVWVRAGSCSLAHDAAGQLARRIVKLDDIDHPALLGVTFDDRKSAVGAEGFNRFGASVEVVIPNLASQNPVRILLNEVGLSVVIAVPLDLDILVVAKGLDQVRSAVRVGIDSELIFGVRDASRPLIG